MLNRAGLRQFYFILFYCVPFKDVDVVWFSALVFPELFSLFTELHIIHAYMLYN